jgi:hypothetical protein
VVQLEKYFDFSLLSLTSLLSAPEREVTSPSDFKVVGFLSSKKKPLLGPHIRQKYKKSNVYERNKFDMRFFSKLYLGVLTSGMDIIKLCQNGKDVHYY